MKAESKDIQAIIARYLHLTRVVMPAIAQEKSRRWPVRNDHCFQRIVLDTICGGVWYDFLERPAYKNLSPEQAQLAVLLCEDIIGERADLVALNQKSLIWRGKLQTADTKKYNAKPKG
jgi:hypothetical protein